MATLSEEVGDIFDEHPSLVADARSGNDAATNRLTAHLMTECGLNAAAAATIVERALSDNDLPASGIDPAGFKSHMDALVANGDRSEWTAEAYSVTIRKFNDWYCEQTASSQAGIPPTEDDVRAWLDHLAELEGLKGSTIQRHFHGVQAYFEWENRSGELASIQVSSLYPDESTETDRLVLDWNDVLALREETVEDNPDVVCRNSDCDRPPWKPAKPAAEYGSPPRCPDCDTRNTDWSRNAIDFAIVQLLSGLGVRTGELLAINFDDIDLDAGLIAIHRTTRTSEWTDQMPLIPADVDAIRDYTTYRNSGVITDQYNEADAFFLTDRRSPSSWRAETDYVRVRLNEVAIQAGVMTYEDDGETKTRVSPRVIRHSVRARLLDKGFNEYDVRRYLGHAASGQPPNFHEMRREIG